MWVGAGASGSCGLDGIPTATPSPEPREVDGSKGFGELLAQSVDKIEGPFLGSYFPIQFSATTWHTAVFD